MDSCYFWSRSVAAWERPGPADNPRPFPDPHGTPQFTALSRDRACPGEPFHCEKTLPRLPGAVPRSPLDRRKGLARKPGSMRRTGMTQKRGARSTVKQPWHLRGNQED